MTAIRENALALTCTMAKIALFLDVQTTATTTVSVMKDSAPVSQDILALTVANRLVQTNAINVVSAIEKQANVFARPDGLMKIAPEDRALLIAMEMECVLMGPVDVTLDGQDKCVRARHVQMVVCSALAIMGCVHATRVMVGSDANTDCVLMTAVIMGYAIESLENAVVSQVGQKTTVQSATVCSDATMASVTMECATAWLDGLASRAM